MLVRARFCGIVLIFIIISVGVIALNLSPVSADPCVVQLGHSVTTVYYSNVEVNVPVSAGCSFVGGQLYAVGDAYDTSTGTDVGSAKTMLNSGYGVNGYTGQLVFNLPSAVTGHTLQISVSIYGGEQYRSLVSASTESVQVYSNNYVNYNSCYYNYSCNYNPNSCQSLGYDGTTQCAGYLYQDQNGCIEVVVPVYSSYGFLSYQYYTLHNLPSSYPPFGSWVSVNGQLNKGYNLSPTGAGCPGNYINVTSIS